MCPQALIIPTGQEGLILPSHAYDRSSQTTEIVQQLASRSSPPLGIIIFLQLPRFLFHLKKTKIRTKMSNALFFHPQSQDNHLDLTTCQTDLAPVLPSEGETTHHPINAVAEYRLPNRFIESTCDSVLAPPPLWH